MSTPPVKPLAQRNLPAPGSELRVEESRPAPPADGPGLRFDVQPLQAEVIVNGRRVGTVEHLRFDGGLLALPAGIHQVSIRHPGHVTWRAEVTVGDRPEPIRVTLTPNP
ncbi:PEGA domain-containing protein [Pyxidicoccus sp. 3LG]